MTSDRVAAVRNIRRNQGDPNQVVEAGSSLLENAVAFPRASDPGDQNTQEGETALRKAQRRTRQLTTLLGFTQKVSATLELDPLLTLIMDQLAEVVEYTSCIILGLEDNEVVVLALRGVEPVVGRFPRRYLAGAEIDRLALPENREPILVADLHANQSMTILFGRILGPQTDAFLQGGRSCIGVPLVVREQVIGLLCIFHCSPNRYSAEDGELMAAFAAQASVALENARLYRRALAAAADEERSRLARELHDAVTQTLFTASVIADVLPAAWRESPELGEKGLAELRDLTRGALAEMRTLLLELRPATLVQKPVREILESLSEAYATRAKLRIELEVNECHDLPSDVQIAIYRITQEALNNVQKHSGASHVRIILDCGDGIVTLRIWDDGVGFDINAVAPDRLGLEIMRERAAKIGGTLDMSSGPARGTAIQFAWTPRTSSILWGE